MRTIKQNLIEMFELDKMPPEKSAEMVERLGKLVFQAVLVRAIPMLSKADLKEYETMTDGGQGGEVMFGFLAEKVPNFDNMVAEEAEMLRKEMAGEFKEAGM